MREKRSPRSATSNISREDRLALLGDSPKDLGDSADTSGKVWGESADFGDEDCTDCGDDDFGESGGCDNGLAEIADCTWFGSGGV